MNVTITLESGIVTVKALTYTFPKKGNAAADYKLTVNDVATEVAQTGGGKYPRYTYFKHNGTSYYLPKDVLPVSGSNIAIIAEEAKKGVAAAAAPVEPAAESAPAVAKKVRIPKSK